MTTSTRPPRLDLDQLLIIVITAPVPPNINSIVLIVQRPPLLRFSGTRSTPKPTLVLTLATKLKLLVRGILVAAECATKSALVVAEVQAGFAQLGFRRWGERLELGWLFGECMSNLDGGGVCCVGVDGLGGLRGLLALREAGGELAAGT